MDRAQIKEYLRNKKTYQTLVILAISTIGLLFFTRFIVTGFLTASVMTTAWMLNKLDMKSIGIETTTFSTVMIAMTYGPLIGAIAGLMLIILQVVAGQYTGGYITWVIPSYAAAGFIAGSIPNMNIFLVGTSLIIGMQTIFAILTSISPMGNISRYLPYAATNVVFNIIIFKLLGPPLHNLMTA